jgi:ankyrin repeat protein
MLLSILNQRLILEIKVSYLFIYSILLRAGANINSVDNDGWTPLHAAAHWDKHDVIKFLLEKNADLDAKNYAVIKLRIFMKFLLLTFFYLGTNTA